MGTFWSDAWSFIQEGLTYFPLAVAGTIVWGLWLYRVILSRMYKPTWSTFRTTTSVVVPSYHEDPDILMRCLESWREQNPTEIIIVLDVADTDAYNRIVELGDSRVNAVLFHHAGKRSALGCGIRLATGEVLVLVDSDTSWTAGLLDAVQMPFEDPEVGGVSTQQNVYQTQLERVAPHGGLARQPALLRLRASHGTSGRGALHLRPHGRVSPQRGDASTRTPRKRVLPWPTLHRGRRRSPHVARDRLWIQDGASVHREGDLNVPVELQGVYEATCALEPELVQDVPHGRNARAGCGARRSSPR